MQSRREAPACAETAGDTTTSGGYHTGRQRQPRQRLKASAFALAVRGPPDNAVLPIACAIWRSRSWKTYGLSSRSACRRSIRRRVRAIARDLATGLVADYGRKHDNAVARFTDDFEACIAHLRFPVTHRRAIRTTNLLERLFVEERRRLKIIPNAFGERAVLKLMFGALTRAAERWKSIKFSEFESRQLSAAKKELDQEYEAQIDLSRKSSKAGPIGRPLQLRPLGLVSRHTQWRAVQNRHHIDKGRHRRSHDETKQNDGDGNASCARWYHSIRD